MNVPYVKQYDENGVVTNPIVEVYKHESPNRSKRRSVLKKQRFYGESKNCHLTVVGTKKFRRVKKEVWDRIEGKVKVIEHYLR